MKHKKYLSRILLNLLIFTNAALWAQTQIESSVIGNGGLTISSQINRIVGTVGQSLIGRTNNQINTIKTGFWEQASKLITDVNLVDEKLLPTEFHLYQNYPNPFNPSTKIRYTIPNVGTSLMKFVQLKVYDVLGNEVATLVDENRQAGSYEIEFDAVNLSSGMYLYKLQAGEFVQTRKMILLK